MESYIEYVLAIVVGLLIWMGFSLKDKNWLKYFSTESGKKILRGVILALCFSLGVAALSFLTGCSGTYFNTASVYAGLDYPFKREHSPQCRFDEPSPDSKSTSNFGVRLNMYESKDKKFKINAKYTHHSCAFGSDRNIYDAVGGEVEYKIF